MTAEQVPADQRPEAKAKPKRRMLDLDALEAEVAGEPLEVQLRGQTFVLPSSMPVGLPIFLNRAMNAAGASDSAGEDDATMAAVECLFGDRAEEALRAGFSLASLVRLATTYGVETEGDRPEPQAEASPTSAPSSTATGTPSKRTSKRTTTSTSGSPSLTPVASESDA